MFIYYTFIKRDIIRLNIKKKINDESSMNQLLKNVKRCNKIFYKIL